MTNPRDAALASAAEIAVEPTSLVAFQSGGRLLIIGPLTAAMAAYERLSAEPSLHCCILATAADHPESEPQNALPQIFYSSGRALSLSGHFGQFSVLLSTADEAQEPVNLAALLDPERDHFDLILDLQPQPQLDFELPPLGYYPVASDAERLTAALAELPGLVGEFEKAKYFTYNPSICAHGNSGLTGCTRCLEACPTGAITSLIDKISVDPYYCQGGGSCATACPTGAIIYSYPQPADMLNRLRALLRGYREAGGQQAVLLFHDSEAGASWLAAHGPLPDQALPVEVEEIGSVGPEIWLSALAYGAQHVLLLCPSTLPASVSHELGTQLGYAQTILQTMGFAATALSRVDINQDSALTTALARPGMPDTLNPAGFAGSNEKRNALFFAVDWLYPQSPERPELAALGPGAPFGEIVIDRDACTLCMACVSVCPASAVTAGGDTPRLDFTEANCVQCGLCEKACPEDAITLSPRLLYQRDQRRQTRVINEEAPFHCISCGTAFATRSVIDKMQAKLESHWMFQDDAARRRLKMCGDCRVKDMFQEQK